MLPRCEPYHDRKNNVLSVIANGAITAALFASFLIQAGGASGTKGVMGGVVVAVQIGACALGVLFIGQDRFQGTIVHDLLVDLADRAGIRPPQHKAPTGTHDLGKATELVRAGDSEITLGAADSDSEVKVVRTNPMRERHQKRPRGRVR